MRIWRRFTLSIVLIVGMALSGCGDGSSTMNVTGVASAGAPLSGTVYLKDSSNPGQEKTTSLNPDGSFSFDVSGLTAPFIIKAVGTCSGENYTLYSFAGNPGTANVNPLSNLAVVRVNSGVDPALLYNAPTPAQMQAAKTSVGVAITEIQSLLQPILSAYGAASTNFISDPYSANHQGLDLLFDTLSITSDSGNLIISNKGNEAPILATALTSNSLSGQIDTTKIPNVETPGSVFIYPSTPFVGEGGTLTFRAVVMFTVNQSVSWSVVEPGGGTITSAGAYTAPAKSGIYHITATSMADTSKSTTVEVTVSQSLPPERKFHRATLLSNGNVLVSGGIGSDEAVLSSAKLYNPSEGIFAATGNMTVPRTGHTATLLSNGKVLIAGGQEINGGSVLSSAELYDPSRGTFTATGNMSTKRSSHAATLLASGKVLITGGANGGVLSSAEMYDPSTGTFTVIGSMTTPRASHAATLLPDDKVLLTGGYGIFPDLSSAELFDPSTGMFTATGNMGTTQGIVTATLLQNGKVLITGMNLPLNTSSNKLYDPSTGIFTTTGVLNSSRSFYTTTLLPNGKVLIPGGINGRAATVTTELYDPTTGTSTPTGDLVIARYGYTTTLLPNGKVLIAGGQGLGGCLSSAELYDPSTGMFTATGNM